MTDLHPHHEDHPEAISRAARRGLILFAIYFAFFAGFLLLNIFSPRIMQATILPLQKVPEGKEPVEVLHLDLHGLNLALVYGLFLILAAIVLAFVYVRLTRKKP
jgi:uncharacterized membrane protein (DUF485 family)